MLTLASLAAALSLLALVLLCGWLVLSSRLAARLDHVMAQRGWVPVAHPLAQLWMLALRSFVLPGRCRRAVVQPDTTRRRLPARSPLTGQGGAKRNSTRKRTRGRNQALQNRG